MVDLRDWLSDEDVVSDFYTGVAYIYFDIKDNTCRRKKYTTNLPDHDYEPGDCIKICNNFDDYILLEIVDIQNDIQILNLITDNYVSPVDNENLGIETAYKTKRYKYEGVKKL